jgi:hypothetical protein
MIVEYIFFLINLFKDINIVNIFVNLVKLFLVRHIYRRRRSYIRVHTHTYGRTHTHLTSTSNSEELRWTSKSRD